MKILGVIVIILGILCLLAPGLTGTSVVIFLGVFVLAALADRLTEVSGQVGTNLVATYKALGGGWQIRQGKEILSEANKKEMMERTSWGGLLETEEVKEPIENKEGGNWRRLDW